MMELEESQLSLCDKEFVDKDYEGREADLIYRVSREADEEIYIFILQELQSTVDYTMIFRILIYVVNNLLRHFLDTDKEEREKKEFRKKLELADAVRMAYERIQLLDGQEKEEFHNWAGNGVDDMAFKYNIIKAFEDERAEGKAESIIELLEEPGDVSPDLRETIMAQKDIAVLKAWHKKAARVESVEEFCAFIEE